MKYKIIGAEEEPAEPITTAELVVTLDGRLAIDVNGICVYLLKKDGSPQTHIETALAAAVKWAKS